MDTMEEERMRVRFDTRWMVGAICSLVAVLPVAICPADAVAGEAPSAPSSLSESPLVISGSPEEAAQLQAQREAELSSPEATRETLESRTAYEGLTAGEAEQLAARAFPALVDEPDGGPPQLPEGTRITGFPSDFAASLALPGGGHGVVESGTAMAADTPSGRVALDLVPRQVGGGFEAATPAAGPGVRIGGRLSEGASLAGAGVTMTPVTETGLPLESSGALAGAGVFFGDSEAAQAGVVDTDSLLKLRPEGFDMETILRSERSPSRLYFRLGLPAGASLEQDGGGAVVLDAGRVLASVRRPLAWDADGVAVAVSMAVQGSTVVLTVERQSSQRFPIVVDPTASEGQGLGKYQLGRGWEFHPETPDEAFTNRQSNGDVGMEDHNPYDFVYKYGNFGLFGHETQGESRIYEFVARSQDVNPSSISSILYIQGPGGIESPVRTAESGVTTTLCVAEGCPASIGTASNWANGGYYKQSALTEGNSSFADLLEEATVYIVQEKAPYVSSLGPCGSTWTNASACKLEMNATDPGIGISEYKLSSPNRAEWGSGTVKIYCESGVECPEHESESTSLVGLPEGEDTVKATVWDAAGLSGSMEAPAKIDNVAPYAITLSGLGPGGQVGAGEYKLKAEATDGSGTTKSSGVQSISLYVDGRLVGSPSGACSPGPCTAHGEWTIFGHDYATGRHTLSVVATDNAGNVGSEQLTMIVHPASPVAIGPGMVNAQSGELALSATDVSLGGGLTVGRSYGSRHLTAGSEGPLGVQWSLSLGAQESLVKQPDGSMILTDASGAQTIFAPDGKGGFVSPAGDANLTLSSTPCEAGQSEFMLKDAASATTTCFRAPAGASGVVWTPSIVKGAVATDTVTYSYQASKATEYSLGSEDNPNRIASGPEGYLWFTTSSSLKIGRISTAGGYLMYSLPAGAGADYIVAGPDGNLWFTDYGANRIGKMTTAGAVTEYSLPAGSKPEGIAAGPDGNLWFTENGTNKIGKITTAGVVTEYSLPVNSAPAGIAVGPDNNLWFTDEGTRRIGKITTGGAITEYSITGGEVTAAIGAGADHNVWFGGGQRIGKITTEGAVTEYSLSPAATYVSSLTPGPDGNVWFTAGETLGRITPSGVLSEYATPSESQLRGVVSGPDGNLWFAEKGIDKIAKMPPTGAIVEPTEALAPVPAGVSCSPELKPGCRALTFNYATATTATGEGRSEWGDASGHLTRVYYTAYNPATKTMKTAEVAHYLYDKQARLRAVWDPRVSPELKTTYGYDAEGHVTALTPPGMQPWTITYGTTPGDASAGRVVKIARPSASEGLWGGQLPVSTEAPAITGSHVVGVRLAVSNGKWSGSPVSYGYQWERCNAAGGECAAIAGATNANYVVASGDAGHTLVAVVTATNGGGSVSTSASVLASEASITEYSPASGAGPEGIVAGPDGNLWFVNNKTNKVGKITTTGKVTEYSLPTGSGPIAIAVGPDKNLWFTDRETSKVGKITTAGTITEYALPSGSAPQGITAGPDGKLWYVDEHTSKVGKITTAGSITEYALPGGSYPVGIAAGSDGNLWLTESSTAKIAKVTTAGSITEYALSSGSYPWNIVAGPDKNLWYTNFFAGKVGKITTSGTVTEYTVPSGKYPMAIASGPDGNLWFSEYGTNESIAKITTAGAISEYAIASKSESMGIASGPDSNIWFTNDGTSKIDQFVVKPAEAEALAPQPGSTVEYGVPLSGTGLSTMTEGEVAKWGQKDDPTEATAVFPPDEPQGWPAAGYRRASVYYRDGTSRTVNVATPGGGVSTSEYNEQNDVTRSLSADNRATALKEANPAEAAKSLDTESEYNGEGNELLATLGPRHTVKLPNGKEVQARSRTSYSYDEGAPAEGGPYRLVTKTTQGAQTETEGEQDVRTTTTSYSGQNGLGWKLRQPTSVTSDPSGLKLTRTTLYDEKTGAVIESRTPAAESTPMSYASQFGSSGTGSGQLKEPTGIAVSPTGNVFVADTKNNRVEEFGASGEYVRAFGASGTGNGQFKTPYGIAVDSHGNVWVADTGNHRVQEFNEKGEYTAQFGSEGIGNGQFKEPKGIVVTAKGAIYVSDNAAARVQEFNEKREYVTKFGTEGTGNGKLKSPKGLAVAANGNVLVADTGNNRVEVFNEKGEYQASFGSAGSGPGQLEEPKGVAVDGGDFYVADTKNNRVEVFGPEYAYLARIGKEGTGNGEFEALFGLASSPNEALYVADANNSRIEQFTPGSPHDTRTVYYTTEANSTYPACGGHPEWANLPCETTPVKQPGTSGLPELPVSTVTYNMYDEPVTATSTVTECVKVSAGTGKYTNSSCTAAGSGEYETKANTRTTTTAYDEAGRALSVETTSTVGEALPKVSDRYSETTGLPVEQSTTAETLKSVYNSLGQLTSYTDADNNTTDYEYENGGDARLVHVDDGQGTQTYAYDSTTGAVKELVDSAAGTFTASYDVEGNLVSEGYPSAMSATTTLNAAGQVTGVQYVKTADCAKSCPETWYSDTVVPSIHGQWMAQQSSQKAQTYSYDQAGRLTQVLDNVSGKGCFTRIYAYDEETNRLSLTTRPPGTGGVCASEGGTVESHSYDTANRLLGTGVSYDAFGNTTKLPGGDAGGAELTSNYYENDMVASETQAGQTLGYQLDPAGRTREAVSTGKVVATEIEHYPSPGATTPSWTGELSTNYTRYITGIGGAMVAIQHNGEKPVLQLANLHGDIVATATDSETATEPASSVSEPSEYGVPATEAPPRYSWLGAHELPTTLPSGAIAMGARTYIPQLGRFLQTDPIPGGSADAYAYTQGNPVNEYDLSGEFGGKGLASWAISGAQKLSDEEAAAYEAAVRAEAERKAAEAAALARAYSGIEGEGFEEEWWPEEEWEEEGGYEEAAYHPGGKPAGKEAHLEEGLLYQPLRGDLNSGREESKQDGRRDVAGGCPSTHDPCYREVHGGHGNPNMGGTGCRNRSGCGRGRVPNDCAAVGSGAGGAIGGVFGGYGALVGGAVGGAIGQGVCGNSRT